MLAGVSRGQVTLLGAASFPGSSRDLSGLTDTIAGIPHNRLGSLGSAIAYTGKDDLYLCVDDRGPGDGIAPFRCRVHVVRIRIDGQVGAELVSTTLLAFSDGSPLVGLKSDLSQVTVGNVLTGRRFDPEGICLDRSGGGFFLAEEYEPRVCRFDPRGTLIEVLQTPEDVGNTKPHADPALERRDSSRGRFPNRGYEGLTITPSGTLFAILQSALIQDSARGKEPGPGDLDLRVISMDSGTGRAGLQYIYRVEASPAGAREPFGVSEILAINDSDFLVLERDGREMRTRKIYRATLKGATAFSEHKPADVIPMDKDATPFIDLMNPSFGLEGTMQSKVEGLTFGPDLPDGRHTLIVTTDNDMTDRPTWFWVFAFTDADLPGLAPRQ